MASLLFTASSTTTITSVIPNTLSLISNETFCVTTPSIANRYEGDVSGRRVRRSLTKESNNSQKSRRQHHQREKCINEDDNDNYHHIQFHREKWNEKCESDRVPDKEWQIGMEETGDNNSSTRQQMFSSSDEQCHLSQSTLDGKIRTIQLNKTTIGSNDEIVNCNICRIGMENDWRQLHDPKTNINRRGEVEAVKEMNKFWQSLYTSSSISSERIDNPTDTDQKKKNILLHLHDQPMKLKHTDYISKTQQSNNMSTTSPPPLSDDRIKLREINDKNRNRSTHITGNNQNQPMKMNNEDNDYIETIKTIQSNTNQFGQGQKKKFVGRSFPNGNDKKRTVNNVLMNQSNNVCITSSSRQRSRMRTVNFNENNVYVNLIPGVPWETNGNVSTTISTSGVQLACDVYHQNENGMISSKINEKESSLLNENQTSTILDKKQFPSIAFHTDTDKDSFAYSSQFHKNDSLERNRRNNDLVQTFIRYTLLQSERMRQNNKMFGKHCGSFDTYYHPNEVMSIIPNRLCTGQNSEDCGTDIMSNMPSLSRSTSTNEQQSNIWPTLQQQNDNAYTNKLFISEESATSNSRNSSVHLKCNSSGKKSILKKDPSILINRFIRRSSLQDLRLISLHSLTLNILKRIIIIIKFFD
ncbi:hypothetical protein SNEBB_009472 [Seison nebaliae]|nr:hypothetical protein SNEBB_009472 [Seison nebaliae]